MILADFTFGQALLTVLEIFVFAAWLMVLFTILGDLFRDHDISGWSKAIKVVFLIFAPSPLRLADLPDRRGQGMRDRAVKQQEAAQKQFDAYVRSTAGGDSAADELTKLAKLHDEHKLSDEEFERARRRSSPDQAETRQKISRCQRRGISARLR